MCFKSFSNTFSKAFFSLVSRAHNVVITTHFSPDDDAIGSSLALFHYLAPKYPHKIFKIVITGSPVSRYNSFVGSDLINYVDDLSLHLKSCDLLIALDGSQFSRFSHFPENISQKQFSSICIDHHGSPPDRFHLSLIDTSAPATASLIMKLINRQKYPPQLAECLLLGILGDTGTVNYLKPQQVYVLDQIKTLVLSIGLEIAEFKARYERYPIRIFELIQEYIHNTVFYNCGPDLKVQYSFITADIKNKHQYTDNEVSEASHIYMAQYIRAIEGFNWGFVVTPRNSECSLSFRSLPHSVSVRDLVERMGIGGGHDRAAGGSFKSIPSGVEPHHYAIEQVKKWISSHQLNYL